MRSFLRPLVAMLALVVLGLGFIAPAALAQEYPPVVPTDPGLPSEEILAVIQATRLVEDAASSAATGDVAGAQDDVAAIQDLLDQAVQQNFSPGTIGDLRALLAKANVALAAATGVPASIPASIPVPTPSLAFTGSSANGLTAAGASLVGAGGLLLLWSRKRSIAQRR